MIYYISLSISIALNALSLILMKSYALTLDMYKTEMKKKILDSRLIISILCYGGSAVLWLIALSGVDLMVAYPSLSLTYVIVGITSPKLFSEEMSSNRWGGILVIITGVIIMNI